MYQARSILSISEKTRAAFNRFATGIDALIVQNVLYVFAKVLAMLLKEVDLRSEYIYNQIFATTADEQHLMKRHAPELGMSIIPPGFASGDIEIEASEAVALPKGLAFVSGGIVYHSTASASIGSAGTLTVPVKALTSGVSGNRSQGEKMALSGDGSYPQIAAIGVVSASGVFGGTDREDKEALRQRILDRKKNPPQGGADYDYERWAREGGFASKVWAREPVGGPGALAVWFLNMNGDLPSVAEIDALQAHFSSKRILGLRKRDVYAPNDVPPTIRVKLSPDTTDLRERVTASIEKMMNERTRPGLPDNDFVLSRSWISEAVSTVVGEDSHELVLPAADVTYGLGDMPVSFVLEFA